MRKIKVLWWFLRNIWRFSPGYVLLLLLKTVTNSLSLILSSVWVKYLLDELFGWQRWKYLLACGLLIVLTNSLAFLLERLFGRYLEQKKVYVNEMIQYTLGSKVMGDPYANLESASYLDLKENAVFAVKNQDAIVAALGGIERILQNIVILLGLSVVLSFLNPVILLLFLLMAAANILCYLLFLRKQLAFMRGIIPLNRKYGYYAGCCMDVALQKDIRLFAMEDLLNHEVSRYNQGIKEGFGRFYREQGRFLGIQSLVFNLQKYLAYGYVGFRVFSDAFGPSIGVGSFSLYSNAIMRFIKGATDLGEAAVEMQQLLEYLEPFAGFMMMEVQEQEGGTDRVPEKITNIRFDHVSFRYPGQETYAIKDASFEIFQGEKISVVGLNGAGKSTLVKLLCRLYRPAEGVISINGKDIWEMDEEQYRDKIACVFQDYALFAFSVKENIVCNGRDASQEELAPLLEETDLQEVFARLPGGMDARLGKEYFEDGVDLSGGEKQKLAIARALYKNAELLILDEPSSALDPLAEARLYEQFDGMSRGKTVLYVSHRMTSSLFCDRVLVIGHGTVEDFDTHANLMQKEGSYRKLYQAQAQYYRNET